MFSSNRIFLKQIYLQKSAFFRVASPNLSIFLSKNFATKNSTTNLQDLSKSRITTSIILPIQSRNFANSSEGSKKSGLESSTAKQNERNSKNETEPRKKISDTEKPRFDKRNGGQEDAQQQELHRKEHEEFVVMSGGGKPNTERMWKSVHEEMASTDTGGYIKLEDIGIDLKEVDAVHKIDNEKDARLQNAKDSTGSSPAARKEKPSNTSSSSEQKGKKNSDKSASSSAPSSVSEDKSQRSKQKIEREKEHDNDSEDENTKPRRTVSSAQQSIVWEGTPRSTTGGAQSSPEAGGIEHLTEQLFDREAAEERSASLERETDKDETSDSDKPKKETKKKN